MATGNCNLHFAGGAAFPVSQRRPTGSPAIHPLPGFSVLMRPTSLNCCLKKVSTLNI